ncbi:cytochrome P450 [Chamaesiphon minutus]|uniref:Cytochrome P450 n=1 Tax=Chamaesiphon minutus (strain ATCC 27169 / PCC 6605) TaxID=1173020 RepID=K9URS6_CHAP6|nr:cytochrome P450 [Chamaesiphon minutus]AFY96969.1 cytochrome P450 [Chamaesiphon minutus PCC 6605]
MINPQPTNRIPGSFGLPIVGQTLELIANQGWQLDKYYHKYGAVFKLRLLGKPYVVLVGADASRLIFQDQIDRVSSYLGWQPFLEHLWGQPMMLQDGEAHRKTRRLMAPAFHGRAIASYFDTIQSIVQNELPTWIQPDPIALKSQLNQIALRIGVRLLLGVELASDVTQFEQWFNTLVEGAAALLRIDIPVTVYGRSQRARRQLNAFLTETIDRRQQQGNLAEAQDVLGLFLASVDEVGNALSTEQIVNELLHLLNAAHFTTATALTWAVVELAARPEWQEILRSELAGVRHDRPLELEHLKHLHQMSAFLKEIERVYNPSGVVLFRQAIESIDYAGYRIPAGWGVIVAQGLTHRLPSLYMHPETFDPTRFLAPREEDKQHPFALIGFGGGAHRCIGMEFAKMEMKIFLATLLSKYDWTVQPNYGRIASVQVPPNIERQLRAIVTEREF